MPLDFPSSPTNGQVDSTGQYVYDSSITSWRNIGSTNDLANRITAVSNRVTTLENGVPLGAWTSYTPTLSNFTAGNGVMSSKYLQIGKTVFVQWDFVIGSTTSFTGTPVITLPFNMRQGAYNAGVGSITNGSGIFAMILNCLNIPYVEMYGINTAGTWGVYGGFVGSLSVATGARLGFTLTYEAA